MRRRTVGASQQRLAQNFDSKLAGLLEEAARSTSSKLAEIAEGVAPQGDYPGGGRMAQSITAQQRGAEGRVMAPAPALWRSHGFAALAGLRPWLAGAGRRFTFLGTVRRAQESFRRSARSARSVEELARARARFETTPALQEARNRPQMGAAFGGRGNVIPVHTPEGVVFRTATVENLAAGTFRYPKGDDFLVNAAHTTQMRDAARDAFLAIFRGLVR